MAAENKKRGRLAAAFVLNDILTYAVRYELVLTENERAINYLAKKIGVEDNEDRDHDIMCIAKEGIKQLFKDSQAQVMTGEEKDFEDHCIEAILDGLDSFFIFDRPTPSWRRP